MTPVIGNTFKLTKANATHSTSIDDRVVVLGYAANAAKSGRMEADIGVFQIEGEAIAAAAVYSSRVSCWLDESLCTSNGRRRRRQQRSHLVLARKTHGRIVVRRRCRRLRL